MTHFHFLKQITQRINVKELKSSLKERTVYICTIRIRFLPTLKTPKFFFSSKCYQMYNEHQIVKKKYIILPILPLISCAILIELSALTGLQLSLWSIRCGLCELGPAQEWQIQGICTTSLPSSPDRQD